LKARLRKGGFNFEAGDSGLDIAIVFPLVMDVNVQVKTLFYYEVVKRYGFFLAELCSGNFSTMI